MRIDVDVIHVPMDTKRTLTRLEKKISEVFGKFRFKEARKAGIKNRKTGPQSDEFIEINSVGSELAFAKLFNVYPDLVIGERPYFDFTLYGKTVDVKCTHYEDGKLLVQKWSIKKQCDLYALMVGALPEYYFKGFAISRDLFQDRNKYAYDRKERRLVRTTQNHTGFCMDQNELKILEDVL